MEYLKLLKSVIHSESDLDLMFDALTRCALDNKPFTDNPMYDGIVIGILSFRQRTVTDILLERQEKVKMLDGTVQQMEMVFGWLSENEEKIVELIVRQ